MKGYNPLAQYQTQSSKFQTPLFKRFLAFLFDISVLSLTVLMPINSFFSQLIPAEEFDAVYLYVTQNESVGNIVSIVLVFLFALMALYFALLEYLLGYTAGKYLLGLRVVTITGKPLTLWQALVRSCVLLPLFPFILFWVIDPVYLALTKRRLTEQLTGTKTITFIKKDTKRFKIWQV